ncbi:ubiquitin-conjugating enzyme e2 [Cryptosporidium canis]|uniref:Ubiquitin-conjugating enzyme e2 n=1 Tax=Cryptosporidium canis TaxID=195482 RepID=A0A9D5DJ61_9CRYT|nr:ubiquitin-conjugating enzyme e2 [Cryptosporidium canis]
MDVSLLRLRKEFEDVGLPEFCRVRFNTELLLNDDEIENLGDTNNLDLDNISSNFVVILRPQEGIWAGKILQFIIRVPKEYPFKPPKVKCLSKILHPNIDKLGHVCINIIREDWKPTLTISIVICGILNLLIEPSNSDPFNQFASVLFESNPSLFKSINRILY